MPQADGETTYCFAFYAWEKELTSNVLDVIEGLFETYGTRPSEGTGFEKNGRRTHGEYRRVRKRIASFLLESDFDLRINGQAESTEDVFYPCNMQFVLGIRKAGYRHGMISMRAHLGETLEQFVDVIQEPLFGLIGSAYATGFEFPAPYGPDFYLSSVSAVPRGYPPVSAEYEARITRWRDRTLNNWFLPRLGFMREVYQINFLLDQHFNKRIPYGKLRDYANSIGILKGCAFNPDVTRWDIVGADLDRVRSDLETSGIILSAE